MAGSASVSSCSGVLMYRSYFQPTHLAVKNVSLCFQKRGCGHRALVAPTSTYGYHLRQNSLKCQCFGTIVGTDGSLPVNWVPVINQALLAAGIVFAYMAGVIPGKCSGTRRKQYKEVEGSSYTYSGRSGDRDDESKAFPQSIWDAINGKLVGALETMSHYGLDDRVVESEYSNMKHPLSLHAIAEGPRIRLLLATLRQFLIEVGNISESYKVADRECWLTVSSESILCSLRRAYMTWLDEEFCLESKKQEEIIVTGFTRRLKEDDSIIRAIKKLGKEELYADLLFFLRYGTLRTDCQYDNKMLTQNGVNILEDILVTLADGIANTYLELVSVDSALSTKINSLGLILCSLSTRQLQKLRNEVSLKQWLHQNIEAVISMYEDRFDLYSLEIYLVEGQRRSSRRPNFLRWLTFQNSKVKAPSLHHVLICPLALPVRRTKELRALIGWRYCFSLFLEFFDIAMPFARAVADKVSSAIAFFLQCLIGRSLGLIYTGIRQALGWK